MKYTSEYYLQKAEQNTPPLFHQTVQTDKTVTICEDANAFFGYTATDAGKHPEVVQTGDSFVLDFGRHCVGRISFRVWDNGRYIDAPVRLKLKFGEIPFEIAHDHSTYHGSLCPSWLIEEVINVDMIGTAPTLTLEPVAPSTPAAPVVEEKKEAPVVQMMKSC